MPLFGLHCFTSRRYCDKEKNFLQKIISRVSYWNLKNQVRNLCGKGKRQNSAKMQKTGSTVICTTISNLHFIIRTRGKREEMKIPSLFSVLFNRLVDEIQNSKFNFRFVQFKV